MCAWWNSLKISALKCLMPFRGFKFSCQTCLFLQIATEIFKKKIFYVLVFCCRKWFWIKKLGIISLTDDWDRLNFCGKRPRKTLRTRRIWFEKVNVMLIWIPSLISVPPTAPSVVCQPRFKMQSRANFPSSQLQIISNFEFPRNFPDFRLRQFFLVLNFAAFHPNLCAISLIFPAAPSVFPSPGSIPCLELLVGWAAWKGGLVDLVSSWSSSLIDMPTYFNHHHH